MRRRDETPGFKEITFRPPTHPGQAKRLALGFFLSSLAFAMGVLFLAVTGLTWGTIAFFALALSNFSVYLAEFLPASQRRATIVLRIVGFCLFAFFAFGIAFGVLLLLR